MNGIKSTWRYSSSSLWCLLSLFCRIISRLRERGWDAEIDFVEEHGHATFFKHKQFRVAEKLTEKGEWPTHPAIDSAELTAPPAWNGMRAGMERCMKNIRVQRLQHELEERLRARKGVFKEALLAFHLHPQHWPILRPGDLALMSEFREVMCAPASVTVTKDSFEAAAAQMPKYGKELEERVHKELLGLVAKLRKDLETKGDGSSEDAAPQDDKPLDVKVLSLATTCFRCTICKRGLFYPEVLKHRCLRSQPPTVKASDIYGQFVAKQVSVNWTNELPMKIAGILEAREPYKYVVEVLKVCGKDAPEKVTAKEMDAVPDLRFVAGKRTVVTWRAMVSSRSTMFGGM